MEERFRSLSCIGEKCCCGAPADHKVDEVIFGDDPRPIRHPLTTYICDAHFVILMGPAAKR